MKSIRLPALLISILFFYACGVQEQNSISRNPTSLSTQISSLEQSTPYPILATIAPTRRGTPSGATSVPDDVTPNIASSTTEPLPAMSPSLTSPTPLIYNTENSITVKLLPSMDEPIQLNGSIAQKIIIIPYHTASSSKWNIIYPSSMLTSLVEYNREVIDSSWQLQPVQKGLIVVELIDTPLCKEDGACPPTRAYIIEFNIK